VIVALVFVGLVALAGLAVDGGNLFVQRRQAQNAADASAIAGARLLAEAIQICGTVDLADLDNSIQLTIIEYAETNGIADTNDSPGDAVNDNVVAYYVDTEGHPVPNETGEGSQVGDGTVPDGAAGIRVDVQDLDETYFIQVAGIDEIPSSASALALVGVINQLPPGGGLIPIAIPMVVVNDFGEGDDWTVFDKDNTICDTDGVCYGDDGDLNQQRAWLNLNHIHNGLYLDSGDSLNRTFLKNVSTADCPSDPTKQLPGLRGYASGLCPYQYPIFTGEVGGIDGDFIHGDPGARSSAVQSVNDHLVGQIAYAPIFDQFYDKDEMEGFFGDGAEAPDGYTGGGGCSTAAGGIYYHVVGFTAFRVEPVDKKDVGELVKGVFVNAVVQGGMTPAEFSGEGGCSSLVHGVMLWD